MENWRQAARILIDTQIKTMNNPAELGLGLPESNLDAALRLVEQVLASRQTPPASKGQNAALSNATLNLEKLLQKMAGKTAVIATSVWRMRKRLEDPDTQEPRESMSKDEVRKLSRDVESITSALEEMGFSVRDRVGEAFDYGLPEKVIDAKPQAGITKERVAETLRPSVYWSTEYWKDTLVQKGEVIIHTPITNPNPKQD